jgi:hypothetical protein
LEEALASTDELQAANMSKCDVFNLALRSVLLQSFSVKQTVLFHRTIWMVSNKASNFAQMKMNSFKVNFCSLKDVKEITMGTTMSR